MLLSWQLVPFERLASARVLVIPANSAVGLKMQGLESGHVFDARDQVEFFRAADTIGFYTRSYESNGVPFSIV